MGCFYVERAWRRPPDQEEAAAQQRGGINISVGAGGALVTMTAALRLMIAVKLDAGETVVDASRQLGASGYLFFEVEPNPSLQM
jgi:hypothetical protein